MTNAHFTVLELLDLPPLERELFLHLARNRPAGADALAAASGHDPATIHDALASLAQKRRVRLLADGRADTVMGSTNLCVLRVLCGNSRIAADNHDTSARASVTYSNREERRSLAKGFGMR